MVKTGELDFSRTFAIAKENRILMKLQILEIGVREREYKRNVQPKPTPIGKNLLECRIKVYKHILNIWLESRLNYSLNSLPQSEQNTSFFFGCFIILPVPQYLQCLIFVSLLLTFIVHHLIY